MIISLVMPAAPLRFAHHHVLRRLRRDRHAQIDPAYREDAAQDHGEDEWHEANRLSWGRRAPGPKSCYVSGRVFFAPPTNS
jgi:hypothetical protein